jgi:hypothetical protein
MKSGRPRPRREGARPPAEPAGPRVRARPPAGERAAPRAPARPDARGHAAPRIHARLPAGVVLGLILAAALWLQRAALRAPFFADDFLFLDQVRHRSLWSALASQDPIGNFARPVGRQLHFWVLSRLGAESPLVFHAVNLALVLAALALLFVVARRLAGTAAAAIATAFVALHYAADVPLLWASGSQDLLALAGALGALALFLAGRRALAALVLLGGLLSKETVLFTPLVAALAARRSGESWGRSLGRAWPLGLAAAAWALLWVAVALRTPGARQAVSWSLGGVAAAFVHLVQVAPGLEWRSGGELRILRLPPPLIPLLVALVAVAFAGGAARHASGSGRPGMPPVVLGVCWAALGTLPIAAVSSVWSAYYYLFALCGLGLALGASLRALPREVALVALSVLAWGSQNGRRLDEFITVAGAWTTQSHVNRFYVERATSRVERYLAQLRAARPTLPRGSTVFFGGLPSFVGFQAGDGPLLRWAYRDSSLRSYYLMQFSAERYRRGPAFAFAILGGDSLSEMPLDQSLLRSFALTAIVSERPRVGLDILELPAAGDPGDVVVAYWRAWAQWGLGDTAAARASLLRAGMTLDRGPTPEIAAAQRLVAERDTAGAIGLMVEAVWRHALDPEVHALFAALGLLNPDMQPTAGIEAYAAVLLAPEVARHWWLLAHAQVLVSRFDEAGRSIERFLALGGGAPEETAAARRMLESLRSRGPGGAVFQRSLHEDAVRSP